MTTQPLVTAANYFTAMMIIPIKNNTNSRRKRDRWIGCTDAAEKDVRVTGGSVGTD